MATSTVRYLRLLLTGIVAVCLTTATLQPKPIFHQDAYVWQRLWTPAVGTAVRQSDLFVDGWRVLAAETEADGRLQVLHPNWGELIRSGRSVTPVIRIDGQIAVWDTNRAVVDIDKVVGDLRSEGIPVSGLEIDYDCATRLLPIYSRFLAQLRGRLGVIHLSVTALPAWLESPDFDELLTQIDEIVLQVHAVRNPHLGLFDAGLARTWADTLAERTFKPFRVALPTYGARVAWDDDGSIVAVESEMPRLIQGVTSAELVASPRQVAALVSDLKRNPPAHFNGIVWFRLPTSDDSRAWSLNTWWSVMQGRLPPDRVILSVRESGTPGLHNLVLVNEGDTDALVPEALKLPPTCDLADGVNGYSLDYGGSDLSLRREQNELLHGHHELLVGWMRCGNNKAAKDVQ